MKNPTALRRIPALFAAALAAGLLLAACGSAPAEKQAAASTAAVAPAGGEWDAGFNAAAETAEMPHDSLELGAEDADAAYGDEPSLTLPQDGRKLILTAELTVEALGYKATCDALQQAAVDAGGYISSTSIDGGAAGSSRTAQFTMRIPVGSYSQFIAAAGQAGSLLNRTESSSDVTDQYVDVEARLKALRTQETRLLELMETSARLADLLEVQGKLTEVQYEIEHYTAQKRSLDNLTTYSTVHIYVQEVQQVTEPVEDSWTSRLGATFRQSWRSAGVFFQELALFLVSILPLLLFLAIVLVVVLLLVRRAAKRRAARPNPVAPPPVYSPAAPAGNGAWPPSPAPAPAPAESTAAEPAATDTAPDDADADIEDKT